MALQNWPDFLLFFLHVAFVSLLFLGIVEVLMKIRTEQEKSRARLTNLEHKLDTIVDLLQQKEDAKKPSGWPQKFPLKCKEAFYEFELFLRNPENFNFAVSYPENLCLF